jgi:hypothetical protein
VPPAVAVAQEILLSTKPNNFCGILGHELLSNVVVSGGQLRFAFIRHSGPRALNLDFGQLDQNLKS